MEKSGSSESSSSRNFLNLDPEISVSRNICIQKFSLLIIVNFNLQEVGTLRGKVSTLHGKVRQLRELQLKKFPESRSRNICIQKFSLLILVNFNLQEVGTLRGKVSTLHGKVRQHNKHKINKRSCRERACPRSVLWSAAERFQKINKLHCALCHCLCCLSYITPFKFPERTVVP